PLFSETVPRHREAVGDRPVVQTPHELAVPGRDRDGDVMRRARYQPGGKVLRLRSELGLLLHLKEHGLGLLPRLPEHAGHLRLGGDFASHREHEQRGQEQLNKAACHGASSRRTMSVILRRWPDPISNRRSYGWKPSRATRSACVPGWMGTSISGTVPTSCPSTYALPHGIALMDTCPSSTRRAMEAGGAGDAGGGAGFVARREGEGAGAARWTRAAAGRATRGARAAGSRSGCTLAGGGALA